MPLRNLAPKETSVRQQNEALVARQTKKETSRWVWSRECFQNINGYFKL